MTDLKAGLIRKAGPSALGGLILLTLLFVVISFEAARERLLSLVVDEPLFLLAALGLMSLAVVWYALSWSAVLGLIRSERIIEPRLISFCLTTWPARYIPGTVPYHAARVLLAGRLGIGKRAVATSILYELVLAVSSATVIGIACVLVVSGGSSLGSVYVLAILPLAALPVLLQPGILVPSINRILRTLGREGFATEDVLRPIQTAFALLLYSVVHVTNGLAFWVLTEAVGGSSVGPVLAIGAYSLASAAGVAALFVPSGIGVREAVLVGLLSSHLSTADALAVAASARAVSVLGDLLPFLVITLWHATKRMFAGSTADAEEAPFGTSRPV